MITSGTHQAPRQSEDLIPAQPPLHATTSPDQGFVAAKAGSTQIGSSSPSLADEKLDPDGNYQPHAQVKPEAGPLAPAEGVTRTPGDAFMHFFGLRKSAWHDLDNVATRESVFDTDLAEYYQPNAKWENINYFDPSFRWTYREEKRVRRKTDLKILLWMVLMFISLNLCRTNLANATADNLLDDLGITKSDYNLGNTLFRIGFLVAELPSQIIGKKLGVDRWLPFQMMIFGILNACQFWMKGRGSFLAFRVLIAFFQGGFIPDAILYMSYFYTKNELPVRLAIFWCVNSSTSLLNGFLAVGILEMRGLGGKAGWQFYFLIIGLLSFFIGVASFFMMTPGPSQTKTKYRPNGMFTDEEIKVIVNKVIRDDPSKATMHNRESLTPRILWNSLCDYDLWPMYLIGLTFGLGSYPISNYFQISMRQLGFSTLMSNLLSVPHTFITVFNLCAITIASEIVNNRTWLCTLENWWFLPFFIALRTLPDPISPWTYFALATLVLGYPYAHAIQVSWTSRNSGSVATRAVSAAVYNMAVQASGAIGANLYQAYDAPRYFAGNSGILACIAINLCLVYPGTFFYYRWRNASKERIWSAMSKEERVEYLKNTPEQGCKRLDFRFAY